MAGVSLIWPFFLRANEAPTWAVIGSGCLCFLLLSPIVLSAKWRKAAYLMTPYEQLYGDPDPLDKYTLLDAEFDSIRECCALKVIKGERGFSVVKWIGRKWDVAAAPTGEGYTFAIFPAFVAARGTASEHRPADPVGIESIEACLVARWNGAAWTPCNLVLIGSISDAQKVLLEQVIG